MVRAYRDQEKTSLKTRTAMTWITCDIRPPELSLSTSHALTTWSSQRQGPVEAIAVPV